MADDASAPIQSTWATRELPILVAALRRLDAGEDFAELAEIGQEIGVTPRQLLAGIRALETASPAYVEVSVGMGWSDDRFGGGAISAVSERARRELGAWPSADGLVELLVEALTQAADDEPEPERKGRLRNAADVLAGMARDVAVNVISARLGRLD